MAAAAAGPTLPQLHRGCSRGGAAPAAYGLQPGRRCLSCMGRGAASTHLVRHILQQPHQLLGQPQAAVRRRHGDGRHVAVPLLPGALDLAKDWECDGDGTVRM